MPANDLNDIRYFTAVVAHGGYAAASRNLGIPRSKLSVRVQKLEDELSTRLIERSTRNFRVTEIGRDFYERCVAILQAAEDARNAVISAQERPRGLIRLGCPMPFVDLVVTRTIQNFLSRYPEVSVQVVGVEHNSDLVGEGIDLEIRSSRERETQSSVVMRRLAKASSVLVASTAFIEEAGAITSIAQLEDLPLLTATSLYDEDTWQMTGPNKEVAIVKKRARLACRSIPAVLAALRSGLGIAMLPEITCRDDLAAGRLVRILPDWSPADEEVYLAFATRKGNSPAVRALIDFFVENAE